MVSTKWLLLLSCCLFAFIVSANAQKSVLTESDIKSAVDNGMAHKKDHFGLKLEDQTRNIFNAMANMNRTVWNQREDKGFSFEAFTPIAWTSECAAISTRQYMPFAVADVTEDMKTPVLYIVVHGQHMKDGEHISA